MKCSDQLEKIAADCSSFLEERYGKGTITPVMGEGDPGSRIMMVGEAPGAEETRLRRPFVGKAGRNLDEFLETVGLDRKDLYITNTVKFRPVKIHERTGSLSNRPPTKKEVNDCLPFLKREIEAVKPLVVVTLGNTPLQALADDKKAVIGSVHGIEIPVIWPQVSFCLFPLYHPASIIYNRSLGEIYLQDLAKLRMYLEEREIIMSGSTNY